MEEDILYEFRNIVEESRTEDNTAYYMKLRDTLDFIENLLTRYKQLEEENKKMEELIENAECDMSTNFIRKSKVKEKIEKIKEKDKKHKTYMKDGRENFITEYLAIPILQELLES